MVLKLLIFLGLLSGIHAKCSLYGLCAGNDGNGIPCTVDQLPQAVDSLKLDARTIKKFNLYCHAYNLENELCCDHEQVSNLVNTLESDVRTWFKKCPSCLRNIFNLYCAVTCDPKQANIVKVERHPQTEFMSSISINVERKYVEGLYESCKDTRHWRNGHDLTAFDEICPNCTDVDFLNRIIRDYPLKQGGHIGNVVESIIPSVKFESCEKSCTCNDCQSACPKTGTESDNGGKGSATSHKVSYVNYLQLVLLSFSLMRY